MLLDLQHKAQQDLTFIREAMERAEGTSSVSGLGGVLMGVIGLVAASIASQFEVLTEQLQIWVIAAGMAVLVGGIATLRKAAVTGAIHWDPARRFLMCLLPVIAVAALFTWHMWPTEQVELLPPMWMLLYGCGVLASGTYAVSTVRALGACFIAIGVFALWLPSHWQNALLALSFGGLHITFGWWLYRHHGG